MVLAKEDGFAGRKVKCRCQAEESFYFFVMNPDFLAMLLPWEQWGSRAVAAFPMGLGECLCNGVIHPTLSQTPGVPPGVGAGQGTLLGCPNLVS